MIAITNCCCKKRFFLCGMIGLMLEPSDNNTVIKKSDHQFSACAHVST